MSLLFDQNLSRHLPSRLLVEFPHCDQVILAGLEGADDKEIWNYAASRRLAIVSKDSDFRDMALAKGPPPQVIWLRIGNRSTSAIVELLRSQKLKIDSFLATSSTGLLEL